MTYEEYQQRVLARASHRWHAEKLDFVDLIKALRDFIEVGNRLDRIKKTLMYGREFSWRREGDSPVEEPCPTPADRDQRLIHAMLGVATEGVEMMEAVHRFFRAGRPFDLTNLKEEFGDAEWYRAFFLATVGQSDEANRLQNDAKLEKRFGSTFTEEAANNRNLEAERRVLDGTSCDDEGCPHYGTAHSHPHG